MSLVQTMPPAVLPVSLAEAKSHLRLEHDDDDAVIAQLIATATARLDGGNGLLGCCLITQSWRLTVPVPTATVRLPLPPHRSVDAVTYVDDAGATQTIDAADVALDAEGIEPAILTRVGGSAWPRRVSVTFTAGYGDAPTDVPEPLRFAILLHVGHLFENRESVTSLGFLKELPHGYADLVGDYRAWAF